MLGRGSNLIVPDEGVDGLVISLSQKGWSGFETLSDGRLRAGAGLRLKNLCGLAAAAGLAGFEFLEGIPGSVGGALRMNAGAMGGWIFDVVDEVRLMSAGGVVSTVPRSANDCSGMMPKSRICSTARSPNNASAHGFTRGSPSSS